LPDHFRVEIESSATSKNVPLPWVHLPALLPEGVRVLVWRAEGVFSVAAGSRQRRITPRQANLPGGETPLGSLRFPFKDTLSLVVLRSLSEDLNLCSLS
jgi:hypothetical protein